METAIRWSPTSTTNEQQFLYVDIASKALKLCQIKENCKRPILSYDVISQHTRLPKFLAFDWRSKESLVATGWSTGEAAIYRLDDETESPVIFPVRSQRYCNAVTFSTQNLLASGLDKVRTDFCLNVWDVNQKLTSNDARGVRSAEPLRKLASSEPVTSIKFFRDYPDTLVAGVKGQFLRIYDLREGNGNPSLQFTTPCVNNVAIDPLDENYIASCNPGSGGHISIWDRRAGSKFSPANMTSNEGQQQMSAALDYGNVVDPKSTIWGLRFSPTKRGTLAALSSEGDFKVFELGKEYISDDYLSSFDRTMGHDSANAYARPIYTRNTRYFPSPFSSQEHVGDGSRKVAAFDFLNLGTSNEAHAITVQANKDVVLYSLPPPYRPISLSSQGPLAYAGRAQDDINFKVIKPSVSPPSKVAEEIQSIRRRASHLPLSEMLQSAPSLFSSSTEAVSLTRSHLPPPIPLSRREEHEKLLLAGKWDPLTVEDALTWLSIPRLRCQEGYLPSNPRNREIVADDSGLVEFWEWVDRARANSEGDSMVIHNIDMNYLGVFFIWNNRLGRSLGNRILTGLSNRSIDISSLIQDLVEELAIPEGKTCYTDHLAHRQLCLRVLGATESVEDLEKT
ncbi:hypothetical protein KEM54_001559, partial [Ascosphaera aggregata]